MVLVPFIHFLPGIARMDHDNGDFRCGLARRRTGGNGHRNDHIHLEHHQFACKSRQAIQYASGVTRLNFNRLAFDPAQFARTIRERHRPHPHNTGLLFQARPKHSDPSHLALCACSERPPSGTT
jgi:hypothetical protein